MVLVEFLDHESELVFINPEHVIKVNRGRHKGTTNIYLLGSHGTHNTHVIVEKSIYEVVQMLKSAS